MVFLLGMATVAAIDLAIFGKKEDDSSAPALN